MFGKRIENKKLAAALDWALALVVALAAFFLVNNFVLSHHAVDGDSMYPSLQNGERLLVSPMPYYFGEPEKGDIIAFSATRRDNTTRDLVKRVVGLPGDLIEYRDGYFYVNNEAYTDIYGDMPQTHQGDMEFPVTVPPGRYFVLGDNLGVSLDSRSDGVGFVDGGSIIGKVVLRIYPFSVLGIPK